MVIDCKAISQAKRDAIKRRAAELGITPTLAVILAVDDPASQVYVRNKRRACEEVGFGFEMYSDINAVGELVTRQDVHGILVQLPLPSGIDANKVIAQIPPEKDVDALTTTNLGRLVLGAYDLAPCTPSGIMTILDNVCGSVSGANCVVIGRSNIVGKPMALLLLRENGTVTICHSKTQNIKEITRRADILVAAVGRPKMIDASYVKEGAVVIDVGIHRDADNKLCGDVDFDSVAPVAGAITPVPGGVGPMTIAMLMHNCVEAVELRKG